MTVAQIENVLICAGECAVTVLPQFGGKISSIRVGNHELLQPPLAPIASRTRTMSFDEGDASGWDECAPSVAPCRVKTETGFAEIPDHGDLWRVEWTKQRAKKQGLGIREQRLERQGPGTRDQGLESDGQESVGQDDASVNLVAKCFSLPLELERGVAIRKEPCGWRLELNYELRNIGAYAVPWSWAAHPLFVAEEGDRIMLPESIRTLRLEGSGGGRLGTSGETVAWPIAKLRDGGTADLRVAEAPNSGIGDKLFAGPLRVTEDWCVLERPSAGVRIRVTFDPITTPYLGLWICYGGWPEQPGPKQACVAMEPATAPVDSLAVTGPWSRELAASESFSWWMEVEIERIER